MSTIRLRELRLSKNLTLKALSEELGLKESALSKYERSEREPNIDMLITFANYFNVSVDYLIGKTDYKNNDNHSISEKLGISEQSIEVIKELATSGSFHSINRIDLLESILQHPQFPSLMSQINQYLLFENVSDVSIKITNPITHKTETKIIPTNLLKSSLTQDITTTFRGIVEGIPYSKHFLNKLPK